MWVTPSFDIKPLVGIPFQDKVRPVFWLEQRCGCDNGFEGVFININLSMKRDSLVRLDEGWVDGWPEIRESLRTLYRSICLYQVLLKLFCNLISVRATNL